MKKRIAFVSALLAMIGNAHAIEQNPVVVELFTSQGCSSCPPADALLQQLSKNPSILALSFHVNYWDSRGWKDPFSSQDNTNRQRQYAHNLRAHSVFTPQIIVNGAYSAVGNVAPDVSEAIAQAQHEPHAMPITLSADTDKHVLKVHVPAGTDSAAPASIFAVRYNRSSTTQVARGENAGRHLASVNDVTELTRLGAWENKDTDYEVALNDNVEEGIAILVQNDFQGPIVGAQSYQK